MCLCADGGGGGEELRARLAMEPTHTHERKGNVPWRSRLPPDEPFTLDPPVDAVGSCGSVYSVSRAETNLTPTS